MARAHRRARTRHRTGPCVMSAPDWRVLVRARLPQLPPAIAEELAQHLGDLYTESIRAGQSEDAAVASATTALEDNEHVEEPLAEARIATTADRQTRGSGWQAGQTLPSETRRGTLFTRFARDVGYALRLVRRQPG